MKELNVLQIVIGFSSNFCTRSALKNHFFAISKSFVTALRYKVTFKRFQDLSYKQFCKSKFSRMHYKTIYKHKDKSRQLDENF